MGRTRPPPHKWGGQGHLPMNGEKKLHLPGKRGGEEAQQELRRAAVEPVPVGLALDAARGGRLVLQPGFGDAPAAAFADTVGAFAQALQRPLDLFAVLVEKVDEKVARLTVGQRLRQVGVLRNPRDHAADDIVQRAMKARLFAALRGQELEELPVSLQPRRWSVSGPLPNRHLLNPPPNSLPDSASFGFRLSQRLHRQAYPLPHN